MAGNESGLFELDAASGELFYKGGGEDFESGTTRFALTVRVSDGDQTADTTVTVNVTDVDEAPSFAQQGYTFALAENADGSTDRRSLGTVAATDPENATLSYSLVAGNESGLFELDAASGELFYKGGGEDFESGTTRFALTVRASAGSETTDTTVTVNLTDVDEVPSFAQQGYTFALAENADGSTDRVSLGTVAATDPEGTTLGYSLVGGNESGLFELDAASGELFYKGGGEDFESGTTRFTLTVRASAGSETTDTTVTVNVTDVEEAVDPQAADGEQATPQTVSEGEDKDFSADTSTSGRVAVGETATGEIGRSGDRDWFAVKLVAGRSYTIDLRGRPTQDGTLSDTYLYGIHDADGNRIAGTMDDDQGYGRNSKVTFTPSESGTHYIAAGGFTSRQGTYEVEVTDVTATIRVAGAAATEGDNTGMLFRVTLESGSSGTVTVNYATADGTAKAGADYTATSGTLTFAPGETEKTVAVAIIDDEVEDSGETFTLVLSDPSGGLLGNTEATGTIFNTESPLTMSEAAGEDLPGDTTTAGTVVAGPGGSVTGNIETTADRDWFAVELEAGTPYRIDLKGRRNDTNFQHGTHDNPKLHGIYDADGNLVDSLPNSDNGGDYYNARAFFTPTAEGTYYLAAGSGGSVGFGGIGTYTLSVVEDGDDYAADTGTMGTVAAGGSVEGHIEVSRDRDWFAVDLQAGMAYQIDLKGRFTGDGSLQIPAIYGVYNSEGYIVATGDNTSELYGGNARMTFTAEETGTYYVSAGGARDFVVECGFGGLVGSYTLSVSEVNPDEFSADTTTTGEVTVGVTAMGELQRWGDQDWFKVALDANTRYRIDLKGRDTSDGTLGDPWIGGIYDSNGDLVVETDTPADTGEDKNSREFFTPDTTGNYYISAQAAAYRSSGTYTLSVTAEAQENLPSLQVADAQADESDGTIVFRVTLDNASSEEVNVDYATVDGTATAPADYVAASGTLTFEPGATEKLVAVTIIDDMMADNGETFTLVLSDPFSATLADSAATGTILNTELEVVSEPEGEDLPADTTTTVTIPVGGSATGEIETASDRDWFQVELEAGRLYRFDLLGLTANAGTLVDPYLYGIYDADGTLQADTQNDDFSDYTINAGVRFAPPQTGTYYVAAGSGAARGGTYTLGVTDDGPVDDHSADTATTSEVAVGGSATGAIGRSDDQDWFAVDLVAGQQYQIDLKGSPTGDGTLPDPYLCGVYNAEGDYVAGTRNDDGGEGANSQATFTPEEDGRYYVAACASLSLTGTYTLSVAEDGM